MRQLAAVLATLCCFLVLAQQSAMADEPDVPVTINVVPTASIAIIGSNLLYLRIPPAGSTIPATGVTFRVTGNASASVTAEPDSFVSVPTVERPSGESMGRATLNGNSVGYRLRLDFPWLGIAGSPAHSAVLPGYEDGPTEPPLAVSLTFTGGSRDGRVHLEASPNWTPDGGLPLPGVYVGTVTLTVSAF